MYLISHNDYSFLKEKQREGLSSLKNPQNENLKVNQHNVALIKNKKREEGKESYTWDKLGKRVNPISKSAFQNSINARMPETTERILGNSYRGSIIDDPTLFITPISSEHGGTPPPSLSEYANSDVFSTLSETPPMSQKSTSTSKTPKKRVPVTLKPHRSSTETGGKDKQTPKA